MCDALIGLLAVAATGIVSTTIRPAICSNRRLRNPKSRTQNSESTRLAAPGKSPTVGLVGGFMPGHNLGASGVGRTIGHRATSTAKPAGERGGGLRNLFAQAG